jgi:hemolysin III
MSPGWAITVLAIVWGGTAVAVAIKFLWLGAPKWLTVAVSLSLGWVAAAAFPELLRVGTPGLLLLLAGGLLYTVGAVVYARQRPDPRPAVFGFHEIFHLLTIAAAASQYAAIAFFVLPRA